MAIKTVLDVVHVTCGDSQCDEDDSQGVGDSIEESPTLQNSPVGVSISVDEEVNDVAEAVRNFDSATDEQVRSLKFCLLSKEMCFESCERGVFIVVSLCFILGMGCGVAGVRIRYERCVHDQVQESGCRALQKPEKHQPLQMKQVSADQV